MATWKFVELPAEAKKDCYGPKCRKPATFEGRYQKRGGLFRFVVTLCAHHKSLLQRSR